MTLFHASRFTYDTPGILRRLWYLMQRDGLEKIRAWVIDNERGERFQLSEQEEIMMTVLWENINTLCQLDRVPLLKSNEVWPATRIDQVRDAVLSAISDRRHGNPGVWNRFEKMQPQEWLDWLRERSEERRVGKECRL